ncbi:hypothetical protein [Paraburkholderia sp.]|uniref:hypothetical protein n=1 Tax=Paraburkholderia sp. TaxID=1926495 RepID=UPI003D6EAD42
MQSMPGALTAHKHDRHFANPSVGWANFPPENAVGPSAGGEIKRLATSGCDVDWTWRAVSSDTVRLTVFISVSAQDLRTPMNSPLCSARREKRPREAGFDEGCVV